MIDKGTTAPRAVIHVEDRESDRNFGEPHHGEKEYRIGDLAAEFDVTQRALRFCEAKGLLAPKRRGNTRIYSLRDRTRLRLVLLGRKVGLSLRDIKTILDLHEPGSTNILQLRIALEKSERQPDSLEEQRVEIDEAIDALRDVIEVMRRQLNTVSDGDTLSA